MKLAILSSLSLALWVPPALAGPLLGDADGDGVDDLIDNCLDAANSAQIDTDGDGCGNACDADYDQSGAVGAADFGIFRSVFGLSIGDPGYNPSVDSDDNNAVGSVEFNLFRARFGGTPGLAGPGLQIPNHVSNTSCTCIQAAFPGSD